MGWIEFVPVFAGFYVLHSVPVRPTVRPWLVARLGQLLVLKVEHQDLRLVGGLGILEMAKQQPLLGGARGLRRGG